jgi:hypothetical protein
MMERALGHVAAHVEAAKGRACPERSEWMRPTATPVAHPRPQGHTGAPTWALFIRISYQPFAISARVVTVRQLRLVVTIPSAASSPFGMNTAPESLFG